MSGDRRERLAEWGLILFVLGTIVFALAQLWRAQGLGLLI